MIESPPSSPSPNKVRALIQEGKLNALSDQYQSAMSKIYDASWKFDRGKDGDFLKTLDNRELPKLQFQTILRTGMNCKLSPDELEAVMPLFDNNGRVNGCEFILLFYRLRYEFRSKLLTERLAKNRRKLHQLKLTEDKKMEVFEQKTQIKLVDDFSEEDRKSALKKVMEGAVKYDRLMPGAVQLDAFEIEYMPPNIFR